MYKLIKVSRPDVAGGLRTNDVIGDILTPLKVGLSFSLIAKPINPEADCRIVQTTPVTGIKVEGQISEFTTQTGSVYKLEEL